MNLKRKGKRRLPARIKIPLVIPGAANEVWSIDFMSDALWSGRRFRTFNVLDDYNREALRRCAGVCANTGIRRIVIAERRISSGAVTT